MSDDLAARLLAVIDEVEEVFGDTVARRCAADRKIVELHSKPWTAAYEGTVCDLCMIGWPCETLRLLAEGYGIQEAGE